MFLFIFMKRFPQICHHPPTGHPYVYHVPFYSIFVLFAIVEQHQLLYVYPYTNNHLLPRLIIIRCLTHWLIHPLVKNKPHLDSFFISHIQNNIHSLIFTFSFSAATVSDASSSSSIFSFIFITFSSFHSPKMKLHIYNVNIKEEKPFNTNL